MSPDDALLQELLQEKPRLHLYTRGEIEDDETEDDDKTEVLETLYEHSGLPSAKWISRLVDSQYLLILLVFVFSGAYVFRLSTPNFLLSTEVLGSFFATIAQGLFGIIGFVIAFLIFALQTIEQKRENAFSNVKSAAKILEEYVQRWPKSISGVILREIMTDLFLLKIMDISIDAGFFKREMIDRKSVAWVEAFTAESEYLDGELIAAGERVIRVLLEVEQNLNRLSVVAIGMFLQTMLLKSLVRMVFALCISLLMLGFLGLSSLQPYWEVIGLPIILSMVTWVFLLLVEVIDFARDYYHNFKSSF